MPGRQLIMNGGLLYHGSPDQSCAVTVQFTTTSWQTHT